MMIKKMTRMKMIKTKINNNSNNKHHKKTQNKITKKPHSKANKNIISNDQIWIYGKHPFFYSLLKQQRKFYKLIISNNNQEDFNNFLNTNPKIKDKVKNICQYLNSTEISNILANAKNQEINHQGYLALASKLQAQDQFQLLKKLYHLNDNNKKLPKLLILDQITDPHNIGAIIRSAIAFNIDEIIISQHNSSWENSTSIKTSTGLIEDINITIVSNINNLITQLKKLNYWIAGLAGQGNDPIAKLKEFDNLALIIGSEGDGIRKLVKKNCDLLTKIDINKNCESLNASVACAIALYELSK